MTAIDPFASVRAPSSTAPPVREPTDQFGKDTFLKLLVAQLRFQNPLSPQDPTQFLAQTAQFTMVEKLIEIEEQNKTAARANEVLASSTLIGRMVTFGIGTEEKPAPIATTEMRVGGNLPSTATGGMAFESNTDVFASDGTRVPLRLRFVRQPDQPDQPDRAAWELHVLHGTQVVGSASWITFDAAGERTSGAVVIPAGALEAIPGTAGKWPGAGITVDLGGSGDPTRLRVGGGAATAAVREQNGSDGRTLTGVVTGVRFDDQLGALLHVGDREIALSKVLEVLPTND